MFFQVIRGRAKSGKSTYCIEQMKKISKQTGSSVLMIVPEQFSYAAEKRLVLAMGGTGINQCEVLTLSRLAHRMLDESRPYIKPAGKQMLLYKSIEMAKKENNIFHKSLSKPGFLDVAAETISEMKRYGISPDFLMEKAQEMDEGMLKFKLDVISRIYKGYADMLSDRFIDSDDDLERLAQYIQKSSNFSDAYIWIDEFSDFLPQHYKVIAALMEKAKGVFVTLCMDEEEDVLSAFSPCVKSLYRLKDIADEIGCPRLDDVYLCRKQKYKSDELMFLEENWDNPKANVYTGRTEAISLFEARDIYSEAEHTAIEILKLVRQEGYRFRDIGILVGSLDDYHHILEVVFAAYNVPYFTDKKTAVTDHAIILLVLSIFDIFSGGFSYESVFR
ncbi:MAG: hypothetical protein N2171_05675, partial [Clostridia bacterium]|nr:hypothetical protein [Clostridia bacterium]